MSVPAVRFRLIPRDEGFFLLFNRAAENAAALAVVVQEVLVRLPDVEPLAEKALELENQGDEVLRDVNRRLDTAVRTPFDREDIHELMQSLDTAVDNMQAAIDLLRLHNIAEAIPEVAEFGDLLAKASEETVAAMAKLSHLRDLQGHLDQIDQIETRGDQLYREVTALLFSGAHKAFVVLKWKDVISLLETALDAFEHTADIITSIALKPSSGPRSSTPSPSPSSVRPSPPPSPRASSSPTCSRSG